jgi:hypothetical protein
MPPTRMRATVLQPSTSTLSGRSCGSNNASSRPKYLISSTTCPRRSAEEAPSSAGTNVTATVLRTSTACPPGTTTPRRPNPQPTSSSPPAERYTPPHSGLQALLRLLHHHHRLPRARQIQSRSTADQVADDARRKAPCKLLDHQPWPEVQLRVHSA